MVNRQAGQLIVYIVYALPAVASFVVAGAAWRTAGGRAPYVYWTFVGFFVVVSTQCGPHCFS